MAQSDFRRDEFVAAVCTVARVLAERFYDNPGLVIPAAFSPPALSGGQKDLMTRQEAANALGKRHPTTIDRLVRQKKLTPHYPTGPNGHAKFDPDDIARLRAQRERAPRKKKE